ncbi:hypothetical protein D9B96_00775, partial [Corynebacterium diphtheriae]
LYAFNIDESVNTDTEQATKALYLGPHLMGVMKRNTRTGEGWVSWPLSPQMPPLPRPSITR